MNPANLIGKNIDQFRLEEFIGRGAMGVVFKAHDNILRRSVALKLIPKGYEASTPAMAEARKRLIQEAQAAGCLTHPNIVTIHSYGETDEFQYICMEYIVGKTLGEVISERRVLPIDEAVAIIEQVLLALDRANQEHIVHRDIKPANIMILQDQRVKVMDFGIAKIPSLSTTTTGTVLGTPYYMSPEQISGQKVDILSDIFSTGAVFYQIITGERPFEGETTVTLAYKIVQIEPIPPKILNIHIPQAIENISKKALAKDPSLRYQTPMEMLQDLREFMTKGLAAEKFSSDADFDRTVMTKAPIPAPASLTDNADRTVISKEKPVFRPASGEVKTLERDQNWPEPPPPARPAAKKEPEPPSPPQPPKKMPESPIPAPPPKKEPVPPVMAQAAKVPPAPGKKAGSPMKAIAITIVVVLVLIGGGVGTLRYLRSGAQTDGTSPATVPPVTKPNPPTPQTSPPVTTQTVPVPQQVPQTAKNPSPGPQPETLVLQAKNQLKSNPTNARKLLDQALAQDPNNFEATFQLARLLTFHKDFQKAIPVYQKAQQLNSQVPEIPFNLGFIYMSQGNFDQAIKYYDICRSLSPPFLDEVVTNLGFCYLQKNNKNEARALFLEALKINPKNNIAKNYLKSIGG